MALVQARKPTAVVLTDTAGNPLGAAALSTGAMTLTSGGATTLDMGASWSSEWYDLGANTGFSVDCQWTGANSPVGTLQLQGYNGGAANDLTGWTCAVDGSGNALFNVPGLFAMYRYFRISYTATSGGSGDTFSAIVCTKG